MPSALRYSRWYSCLIRRLTIILKKTKKTEIMKTKLLIALCIVSLTTLAQQQKPKVNYSIGLSLSKSTDNNNVTQHYTSIEFGANVISKKYNTTIYINGVRVKQSNGVKSNGINFNINLDNNLSYYKPKIKS